MSPDPPDLPVPIGPAERICPGWHPAIETPQPISKASWGPSNKTR
jgi:hypothetical protein